jgi:hypothetical protein
MVLWFCLLLAGIGMAWFGWRKDPAIEPVSPAVMFSSVAARDFIGPVSPTAWPGNLDHRLEMVQALLGRLHALGPADRGPEDYIRLTLAGLLTDENAGSIVRALAPGHPDEEFILTAFSRWSTHDLPAAELWLQGQPNPSYGQTEVLAHAMVGNPVAREVICDQLPVGPWRDALLECTSRALAADDAPAAVALAARLPAGQVKKRTLLAIADEWAQRDPLAAAHWMAMEPDAVLRDELIMTGAVARTSVDPLDAFHWALAIRSDDVFEQATERIGAVWADYAPRAANEFTGGLVSGGPPLAANSDP